MKKVYEVEYMVNKDTIYEGTATTKIRAINAAEAKRITKQRTGCLIKNMRISTIYGTAYRAAND